MQNVVSIGGDDEVPLVSPVRYENEEPEEERPEYEPLPDLDAVGPDVTGPNVVHASEPSSSSAIPMTPPRVVPPPSPPGDNPQAAVDDAAANGVADAPANCKLWK